MDVDFLKSLSLRSREMNKRKIKQRSTCGKSTIDDEMEESYRAPLVIMLGSFSGAPAARRAAKRSPIIIMRKKTKPMGWFSHGYHG